MRDCDKLLEWLKSSNQHCYLYGCDKCPAECEGYEAVIFKEAADAIEELVAELVTLRNQLPKGVE